MNLRTAMMMLAMASLVHGEELVLDQTEEWQGALASQQGVSLEDGMVKCTEPTAGFQSKVIPLDGKQKLKSLVLKQSDAWLNWKPAGKVLPKELGDAPVMLVKGDKDYWVFGKGARRGGYHAWQSSDMKTWVHHGPVTEQFSRWVTTAELVDGKAYIYYDFPNDQDPHLYIDEDLTDGKPGKNMGMAFKDPSHGSDCTVIRDLDGRFHLIYEDWSPINARRHSWDSPLAGHAVSEKGYGDFKIVEPAVDMRTKPTGEKGTFNHPHWRKEDPENYESNVAEYEIHEPEQDAWGDWAAIAIGGQYYLFGDFHPAGKEIRLGWLSSSSIDEPFTYCGEIGSGHPDPDIGFAEGQFYLVNQTKTDYISDGPWIGGVSARAGVDSDGDGKVDQWTEWQEVREAYGYIEGFSKQISRTPAALDCSGLPEAKGVAFEVKFKALDGDVAKPEFDKASFQFAD